MPPRQDIVPQPERFIIREVRVPPPPTPGRLQRPPQDHPATYITRPNNAAQNNTATRQTVQ